MKRAHGKKLYFSPPMFKEDFERHVIRITDDEIIYVGKQNNGP